MKKDKRERKMTPEQLQGLLHMRKRSFVQKNGKAYNRKQKHKKGRLRQSSAGALHYLIQSFVGFWEIPRILS